LQVLVVEHTTMVAVAALADYYQEVVLLLLVGQT
jgi:hypothetical protein